MTDAMKQAHRELQRVIISEHPRCEYAEVHFEKGGASITIREKDYTSLKLEDVK